jgi:predicted Zn-dependent peptidase
MANGLRLVAVEMPHLHTVEIAVYIRVGGGNDQRHKAGLAHFLEHMLFRGSSEFPSTLELEVAFDAIGGSVNAATDEESTCYYSRIHPDHVPRGISLFSSMLLRPTLPGIDIEKRIITEEALEDINEQGEETNPHNLASKMLWPDHPLGMPTIGFLETIDSFTESDLRQYLAKHYVPSNTVIAIVGKVETESAFAACEEHFGSWQGGTAPQIAPTENNQTTAQTLFVKDSDSQTSLLMAFRGYARRDQRIMVTRLIRRILCGGGSSRLHLSLREKLGIVYSVDAALTAYDETGFFSIELATSPDNLVVAIAEVLKELRRLATEPVSGEELARVREGYFYDLEFSLDSTYEMQVRYGWGELMGIIRTIEDDRAEAATITSAALMATAADLFAPRNLNLVAVGPWKAATRRQVEKMLKEYAREWA